MPSTTATRLAQFTGDVLRTGHDTPYAIEAGAFIGTDHSTVVLDPRALLDPEHRKAVVVARDSPIGVGDMDTSLYLLFGEIRRHSTVALSGEAADEVFGGYPWFHNPKALAAETFPWLLVTGDEAAMPLNPELDLRIGEFRDDTYRSALAAVPHLDGETPTEHRQREMQHLSLTRWLRQLLHRKDRLSMARVWRSASRTATTASSSTPSPPPGPSRASTAARRACCAPPAPGSPPTPCCTAPRTTTRPPTIPTTTAAYRTWPVTPCPSIRSAPWPTRPASSPAWTRRPTSWSGATVCASNASSTSPCGWTTTSPNSPSEEPA